MGARRPPRLLLKMDFYFRADPQDHKLCLLGSSKGQYLFLTFSTGPKRPQGVLKSPEYMFY